MTATPDLKSALRERDEPLGESDLDTSINDKPEGEPRNAPSPSCMAVPAPARVDFGEIVRSVVALYGVHQGVVWDVRVDGTLGVVRVDADQLRRALINLIDNAVAAVRGVGPIEIVARPWSGPGSLSVEVADRGPGIDAAHRDKVFTPYFSTNPRGTGLGLSIVQRIVVEHHGTIRVEDNAGGGARFVIEIPGGETLGEARVDAAHATGGSDES